MTRLAWHPARSDGRTYHASLRAGRDRSGVYCIRVRGFFGGAEVVYVGESHTDRLYQTCTRHFQSWTAGGWFTRARGPVNTYDPDACDVAVVLCPAGRVGALQARLIDELQPRDNLIKPVPF